MIAETRGEALAQFAEHAQSLGADAVLAMPFRFR
ncbi:YbjQ family protein [Acidithiobacillus caldus]|nr:YbjQ family protein [Acidithiobacillus caldus]